MTAPQSAAVLAASAGKPCPNDNAARIAAATQLFAEEIELRRLARRT